MPLACKASALPFELHPRFVNAIRKLYIFNIYDEHSTHFIYFLISVMVAAATCFRFPAMTGMEIDREKNIQRKHSTYQSLVAISHYLFLSHSSSVSFMSQKYH